jgi:type I protein arginine methyltransferase
MYHYTKQIIKDNFLDDKITLYQGEIAEIELPVDRVDIIISDWMGSFLLYESKIHDIIRARDKWLNDDGLIIPDRAIINLAAIEDYQFKDIKINFWRNVYDIDMSPIRKAAICEVLSDNIDKNNIISTICPIYEINLYTVNEEDLDFASKYELKIMKDESLHALITWFDVHFDNLPFPVSFNTSPFNEPTFWKQCILYLDDEYSVHKGDTIKGSIAVRRSLYNKSHLDVKVSCNIGGRQDKDTNFIQLFKFR